MRKINGKRLLLLAFLAALLLGVSGCLIKPDKTVDDEPSPANVLPFATATPSPTPAPTDVGDQSGWEGGTTITAPPPVIVTSPPTPIPTIAIITPSPAPARTATPTPKATQKASDGTLRLGDSGSAVRTMQQRLKDLGYYTGSVDGEFGSGTEKALKNFQSANGLTADGVAGSKTLTALNSSNAKSSTANSAYATSRPTPKTYTPSTLGKYTRYLQLGSSGTEVKKLQQRLKDLGYFNGSVNGNFGQDTYDALVIFQERNGLYADGVAGEDTQSELYSDSALANKKSVALPANVTLQYRTLRTGMTGDDVRVLQERLGFLYYLDSRPDGVYSATTELAVKVFQQRNGLTVDGVAGSGTQQKLYGSSALPAPTVQPSQANTATLQIGSTGEEVYRLQERLYDLGYYTGRIDGSYTEAVQTAVRAFQTANKLTADGKAGKTTQAKIYSVDAVKASSVDDTLATLRQGDSGERVRALQALLTNYGYYTGIIDGSYTAAVATAVERLQAQNGLYVDGIAGPATQQLLYYGTPSRASAANTESASLPAYQTLRQGMSGTDVMVFQQFLKDAGFYFGDIDGNFGATTVSAVKAFQTENGLVADGIAGAATLSVLYRSGTTIAANAVTEWEGAGLTQVVRTTMRLGDEGQDVYDLQSRLEVLGYLTSGATGSYNADTKTAVSAFQQRNGLTVDGTAGPETIKAMYAVDVMAALGVSPVLASNLGTVTNRVRELEEQEATGAIQASLAGGGVAASTGGRIYYAGGKNGSLYMQGSGTETQIFDSPVRFIHAGSKGVTFVSAGRVLRVPLSGGSAEQLLEADKLEKLSLVGDTMFYLESGALVKATTLGTSSVIASNINDFCIDIYQYTAYTASADGIKVVALNGNGQELLSSMPANQVQICDSVVFFRSGGSLYRIENGISVLLSHSDASWMGIYRDKIYYITAGTLYRCDTNGQNHEVFYANQATDVSFVSGNAYITRDPGGPIVQILAVE